MRKLYLILLTINFIPFFIYSQKDDVAIRCISSAEGVDKPTFTVFRRIQSAAEMGHIDVKKGDIILVEEESLQNKVKLPEAGG